MEEPEYIAENKAISRCPATIVILPEVLQMNALSVLSTQNARSTSLPQAMKDVK